MASVKHYFAATRPSLLTLAFLILSRPFPNADFEHISPRECER